MTTYQAWIGAVGSAFEQVFRERWDYPHRISLANSVGDSIIVTLRIDGRLDVPPVCWVTSKSGMERSRATPLCYARCALQPRGWLSPLRLSEDDDTDCYCHCWGYGCEHVSGYALRVHEAADGA